MIERYGACGTEQDGIFFTESQIAGAKVLEHIHAEISRQNANLTMVKESLARQATDLGANAVMNFRYGQRAHGLLELISFKWDTESWRGEGDAVRL